MWSPGGSQLRAGVGSPGQNGGPKCEIGVPSVSLTTSDAYDYMSLEGCMHENHDQGAAAVLPGGTALFATLDGHGAEGAAVSRYCVKNLLAGVAAMLRAEKTAPEAIEWAFSRTSDTMAQHLTDCRFSGSTAVVSVMQHTPEGRVLTTGWVGDSRGVVGRNVKAQKALTSVAITHDHKPEYPKERQRLAEARAIVRPSRVIHPHTGAWIEVGAVRVWDSSQIYGVAMSRALGDHQVHPFLIAKPDVSVRMLDDKDRVLVLASDGVWDVMENDEAVQLAASSSPRVASREIVEVCAKRWDGNMPGRRDDITCVVVDLAHPDLIL